MSRRDPQHLDEQLCFALYNAQRAVTRAYAPLLEPLGLTYPQYLALLVLWERDGLLVAAVPMRLDRVACSTLKDAIIPSPSGTGLRGAAPE